MSEFVWSRALQATTPISVWDRDERDAMLVRLGAAGISHMVIGHNKVTDRTTLGSAPAAAAHTMITTHTTEVVYTDPIVNLQADTATGGAAVSVIQVPCFDLDGAHQRQALSWRTITHTHGRPEMAALILSITQCFQKLQADEGGGEGHELSSVYAAVPQACVFKAGQGPG